MTLYALVPVRVKIESNSASEINRAQSIVAAWVRENNMNTPIEVRRPYDSIGVKSDPEEVEPEYTGEYSLNQNELMDHLVQRLYDSIVNDEAVNEYTTRELVTFCEQLGFEPLGELTELQEQICTMHTESLLRAIITKMLLKV